MRLAPQAKGRRPQAIRPLSRPAKPAAPVPANVKAGSLLDVASGLFRYWEAQARTPEESPRRGTIVHKVFTDRKKHLTDFLTHLNAQHGQGAAGWLRLADLEMDAVEPYNAELVRMDYSESQVDKRLQVIKSLIDRAGRKKYGQQQLEWNWASRDKVRGAATKPWRTPTLAQLKKVLRACGPRVQAMVWMAIGLGFGQRDLAAVEVGTIDKHGYDLRRSKTGIERYGETPPAVWSAMSAYLRSGPRPPGSLLFVTRQGNPIVHGYIDAVWQWWDDLRTRVGESRETLGGFYMLRHLGATEFGSRPGCSIGDMKRWLGHGASSSMADRYMRPVPPEHRAVVVWVRDALRLGRYSLRPNKADA